MTIPAELVAVFGAISVLITALVSWYAARNAYRSQQDEASLNKEVQRVDEAKALVELSSSLVRSVNEELERVRSELHDERERREGEEQSVRELQRELKAAERHVTELMRQLDTAEARTVEMQEQMAALSAELHEFRGSGRAVDVRTRWDDDNEDGGH